MPSSPDSPLQELQHQIVRELLYRDSADLASRIVVDGRGVERGLGVYRTNARENFAAALEASFPLLLHCVGADEFRQLAWAYQRACPSTAGNLFHVGNRLAGFLADHVRGTGDEYLIDVARLEWLVQEAMVAADGDAALDLPALAAVPAERQGEIRFQLHPSVRLLRTQFGVYSLWEALQSGRAVPAPLRADERLLVQRLAGGVQLQRLPEADMAWLEALQAGATLSAAARTLTLGADDALGALLVRWVAAGVLTSFT